MRNGAEFIDLNFFCYNAFSLFRLPPSAPFLHGPEYRTRLTIAGKEKAKPGEAADVELDGMRHYLRSKKRTLDQKSLLSRFRQAR